MYDFKFVIDPAAIRCGAHPATLYFHPLELLMPNEIFRTFGRYVFCPKHRERPNSGSAPKRLRPARMK